MQGMAVNKRNVNDDCIRVMAMIMVIMIHANYADLIVSPWLRAVIMTIISTCNCFFFMLSGKYNLRIDFGTEGKNGIIRYYKKRFIDIVFPYVIISMLLSIWNFARQIDQPMTWKSYLLFAMKELFSENAYTHLWFMYPLIGFVLSTPFLSHMLHRMSDSELHIMMIVGLLWNTITTMFQNTGHVFGYYGWIMTGWLIYYIAGYYFDRVTQGDAGDTIVRWYIISGVIGYIVNILGMVFFADRYFNYSDFAIPFTLFCFGAFLFLERKVVIHNNKLSLVLARIVKHSFMIYMIHFSILNYLVTEYVSISSPLLQYCVKVIITLIVSLCISVLIDYLLGIVQQVMKKMV